MESRSDFHRARPRGSITEGLERGLAVVIGVATD
jgi:hypothetical protein